MRGADLGWVPAPVAQRGDLTGAPPLAQQLFDQSHRHPKAGGYLRLGALAPVVGRHDPFT